jgi:prepilin-type N-terminal cleavage/methylation domain-containing protein
MLRKAQAFTLIELLIVVAIIAILAAIAIPNFLEAQTRAKVSRIKSDFRSLATALEAFAVDNNTYPTGRPGSLAMGGGQINKIYELSTPVAYITSTNLRDPFDPGTNVFGVKGDFTYQYMSFWTDSEWMKYHAAVPVLGLTYYKAWMLQSWGPDRKQDSVEWWLLFPDDPARGGVNGIYDPTNGTISRGDIARVGGEPPSHVGAVLGR